MSRFDDSEFEVEMTETYVEHGGADRRQHEQEIRKAWEQGASGGFMLVAGAILAAVGATIVAVIAKLAS